MRISYLVNVLFGITLANAKLIMLIRHGEKISDDYTDLSPKGEARAQCLVQTFGPNGYYTTPQIIYAQSPTEKRLSTRPRDTVIPLAESLGLNVDLTYTSGKYKKLAKYILTSPEEVILVSWGNDRIPNIAEELGIPNPPEWKGKVFDDVWILTDDTTPYIQNAQSNMAPTRSFTGTKGLNMVIVKENIEQCISEKISVGASANTAASSSPMSSSVAEGNDYQVLASSAEMMKASRITLVSLFLVALLFF